MFALLAACTQNSVAAAEEPHLTVSVEVVNPHREVIAGQDLTLVASLISRGFDNRFDVLVTYIIRKEDGMLVLSESETVAVEVRNSLSKRLSIGEDMLGSYVLDVTAEPLPSTGKKASASTTFVVTKMSKGESNFFVYALGSLVVLFAAATLYEHHRVTVLFKLSEESLRRRAEK